MATTAVRVATVSSRLLVGLLAAAIFLNYVDRGLLGVAGPLMKSELGLSATAFGFAVSAFFWIYAPMQLLVGWLCDRICVYRLFAASIALWAISTALTGLVGGLAMLLLLRLCLGIGESIAFPGSSKIIARHVPASERGMANAWVGTGQVLGPAFGTLAGGMVMAGFGWRAMFVAFGLATLIWLLPWLTVVRPLTGAARPAPEPPFPLSRLIGRRALWGTALGHFSANYSLYFLLSWLPLYLVQARGFTIQGMSLVASSVFLVQGVSCLFWGWLSDRWTASGRPEADIRKMLVVGGHLATMVCIAATAMVESRTMMIAMLLLTGAFGATITGNLFTIGQIFAGPRAAGGWIGIQNFIGNLAGIVGPIVTGILIDRTGSYYSAIILAAAVTGAGALCWWRIVPRIEPIDFEEDQAGQAKERLVSPAISPEAT